MSDLYDRIVEQRGSLERLVASIPGFKGYQDKQARRTADELLRAHVANAVQQRIQRLVRIEKILLDTVGMSAVSKTRDLKAKMQHYHDKIESLAPGYSGMWAQMKIGAEELETIYSFDEAQIRYVEQFDTLLDAIEVRAKAGENADDTVYDFDSVVSEALDALNLRDELFTGLAK